MPTKGQAQVKIVPDTQSSRIPRDIAGMPPGETGEIISRQTGPVSVRAARSAVNQVAAEIHEHRPRLDSGDRHLSEAAYAFLKRTFDLGLGSILLLVALPIVLAAAVAIRLDTPGSPFFFQTRIGRNGRPFTIFKLRGMFIDARSRFPEYYDYSKKRDLEFCFHHEHDPRVTRAGRFLRKTSIDELPNLWNVVKGDVSLVGPRPEIPEVIALYGPYRDEYLSVKPGITCLSKVTGRDRLTKRETIEFDLAYIRKHCFSMDMKIIWRTFCGVVLRRDVY